MPGALDHPAIGVSHYDISRFPFSNAQKLGLQGIRFHGRKIFREGKGLPQVHQGTGQIRSGEVKAGEKGTDRQSIGDAALP